MITVVKPKPHFKQACAKSKLFRALDLNFDTKCSQFWFWTWSIVTSPFPGQFCKLSSLRVYECYECCLHLFTVKSWNQDVFTAFKGIATECSVSTCGADHWPAAAAPVLLSSLRPEREVKCALAEDLRRAKIEHLEKVWIRMNQIWIKIECKKK